METVTFEIAAALGDPTDRSLGIMIRHGATLVAARSFRLPPAWPMGTVLLWIDRVALAWAIPELTDPDPMYRLLDQLEEACGPFGY